MIIEAGASGNELVLNHQVTGARLIEDLIRQKVAVYACAISALRSAFRDLQVSQDSKQTIMWDPDNLGEPPYFTPMVVCLESLSIKLNSKKHGVHEDWANVKGSVTLPKGACLAQGPVFHFMESGMRGLITIRLDEKLDDGQFYIQPVDDGAFGFNVFCGAKLARFFRSGGESTGRRADITSHIVTACFVCLQRKYADDDGDEGWSTYKSLEMLSDHLIELDYCDWTDPEFSPEKAATLLYPHTMIDELSPG